MKTITITIECRKFEEWDKETQKVILKKHRDINVEYVDWYTAVYIDWAEKLAEYGFDVTDVEFYNKRKYNPETCRVEETAEKEKRTVYNINYTGFWSQGDGASFTTKNISIEKWLRKIDNKKYSRILKLLENNISSELSYSAEIHRRNSRYYHERSTTLNINWYPYKVYDMPNILGLLEDIEKELEEHIIELNSGIYKSLQEEYEYLTSDESVSNTLIANEYEFDKEGNIM
jgi:hypothetical protein